MNENHIFPFLWLRGEPADVIKEELQKIRECGIRSVCVEARPHDEFCKDGWWRDLNIIISEAKKHDMKIWILDDKHFPTGYANGLIEEKYPERKKVYIAVSKADVYGSSRLITLNVRRMLKPSIGYWEIGKKADEEERSRNKLLAVLAVKCAEGMKVHEESIDLMKYFDGENVTFRIPGGAWRIYVIYKTRTDGGNDSYINMIDKTSAHTQIEAVYEPHYEHLKDEFGKTIAGFFSDEPQFGNTSEMCYDARLGKKRMPLPWSDELQKMFLDKYGEDYVRLLPYLFDDTAEEDMEIRIRYDYMDFVSSLYRENFSNVLGRWCEEHGVEYIGHVVEDNGLHSRLGMGAAHYFRAMEGQHMAGIDCIGSQVIYGGAVQGRQGMGETGGDGEFYHYVLGKLGASCAHLDPKKQGRCMCELFGAYGWSFGVRDMKYLLDHMLARGVNYLVPHAFSMADYPDPDCPPHFYAHGNNPQFPYFAKLMKYADRMCNLLSGGTHIPSAAVLYDGEADWTGGNMPMQKVCRKLMENQIDFDIVSMDILDDPARYNGRIEKDKLFINGMCFRSLIIPYTKAVPEKLASFIQKAGKFPIIFAGDYPEKIIDGRDVEDTLVSIRKCFCIKPDDLPEFLKDHKLSEISVFPSFRELSFYHYKKEKNIYVFLNESAVERFEGKIFLPSCKNLVCYDGLADEYKTLELIRTENGTEISLELEPGEICVFVEKENGKDMKPYLSFHSHLPEEGEILDLSTGWKVSKAKAKEYPRFGEEKEISELAPVSENDPSFSGIIRYRKKITLKSAPFRACIKAEHVYELMRVTVNGTEAGIRLTPPYQVVLDGKLQQGDNEIVIEITTTPARDQFNYPGPPFDFLYEPVEATGMFGKILLYMNN